MREWKYGCVLKVMWCAVYVCLHWRLSEQQTDTTSSFQTEHQVQCSHSSFNTNAICVCVLGNWIFHKEYQMDLCVCRECLYFFPTPVREREKGVWLHWFSFVHLDKHLCIMIDKWLSSKWEFWAKFTFTCFQACWMKTRCAQVLISLAYTLGWIQCSHNGHQSYLLSTSTETQCCRT